MSFNIRYGTAEDGLNRWENRKGLVIGRIQAFQPDLLGIQECRDDGQAEYMKENLPDYQFYGVRRGGDDQTTLEMAPILFRKAAFQLLEAGCFWLSKTPKVAGSKSWDATFARTATWCRLAHWQTGRELVFINTHFDYQPAAIAGSARLLRRKIVELLGTSPLVVTGDFNADKQSAAYLQLTKGPLLVDAHRRVNSTQEDEPTFHAYGQPAELTAIDWLLVSPDFKVHSAAVDPYHEGDIYPSDHFPVLAELEL